MKKGVMGRILTRPVFFAVMTAMIVVWTSGCSKSGSGSPSEGKSTGSLKVSPATGGAITVDVPDGTTVTLEIPEGALEQSTDITLTVVTEGTREATSSAKSGDSGVFSNLKISVKPALDLMEAATVSVSFPENAKNIERYITLENGSAKRIPLKQGFIENTLKASVYRLGDLECSKPDIEDMLAAAYALLAEEPEGVWQDAYALFDALLYFSARFGENGKMGESQECFTAVADLCKKSALAYLSAAAPKGDTKDNRQMNALKKFRNLMVLCENPDDIVKSFDAQLLVSDSM